MDGSNPRHINIWTAGSGTVDSATLIWKKNPIKLRVCFHGINDAGHKQRRGTPPNVVLAENPLLRAAL